MVKVKIYFVDETYREFDEDSEFIQRFNKLTQMGFEGKELIDTLITDDWGAPPRTVIIEGSDSNGEKVNHTISYKK